MVGFGSHAIWDRKWNILVNETNGHVHKVKGHSGIDFHRKIKRTKNNRSVLIRNKARNRRFGTGKYVPRVFPN